MIEFTYNWWQTLNVHGTWSPPSHGPSWDHDAGLWAHLLPHFPFFSVDFLSKPCLGLMQDTQFHICFAFKTALWLPIWNQTFQMSLQAPKVGSYKGNPGYANRLAGTRLNQQSKQEGNSSKGSGSGGPKQQMATALPTVGRRTLVMLYGTNRSRRELKVA